MLMLTLKEEAEVSINEILSLLKGIHELEKFYFLFDLRAETLPGITFREEELLVSSLLNSEVALLAEGTELLSLNTRVMLTTTDPLLQ